MVLLQGFDSWVCSYFALSICHGSDCDWVQEPDWPCLERWCLWRCWFSWRCLVLWWHDFRSCLLHCWDFRCVCFHFSLSFFLSQFPSLVMLCFLVWKCTSLLVSVRKGCFWLKISGGIFFLFPSLCLFLLL